MSHQVNEDLSFCARMQTPDMLANSQLRRIARWLIMACLAASAVGAETVSLNAPSTEVALDDTVQVTVNVAGMSSFAVWGQCLRWDTTILTMVSQDEPTTSLGEVVADSRTPSEITSSGEVRTGGYFVNGSTYGDNSGGSGSIARFTFTRIAAGTTTITVVLKDGATAPFGAAFIDAMGNERSSTAPASLTFTEPAVATPMVAVSRGGAGVVDGGSDTVIGTTAGVMSNSLTYRIINEGSGVLILGSFSALSASNCTVNITNQPSTSLTNGASSELILSIRPTSLGAWSVSLTATTNDAPRNPINWTISGSAAHGPGDLNSDGVVNVTDLTLVRSNFGKTSSSSDWDVVADANGDSVINVNDLSVTTSKLGTSY